MERKDRNIISEILLVVGVIFIMIAGGVFVSKTWHYLPETGKKIILLLVTVAIMVLSQWLAAKPKVEKAGSALYYLGTGFAGYLVVALSGGVHRSLFQLWWEHDTVKNTEWMQVFLVHFVMLILMAFHYYQKRSNISYGCMLELLVGTIWYGLLLCGWQLRFWDLMVIAFGVHLGWLLQVRSKVLRMILLCWGEVMALTQPDITIPAAFLYEWNCFLLAIGIVLLGVIWYDTWKGIYWIQYGCGCYLLWGLLLHDLSDGNIGNVLILGLISLCILLAGARWDRKELVLISAAILLILAFYLTRSFWLSIAWWGYLFAAGVILIIVAILKLSKS